MALYRKKPVVIEAEPYRKGLEDGFTCNEQMMCVLNWTCECCTNSMPYIHTLEGIHIITPTDMIITGVKGERYPCKLDIFNMTYEKVGEEI